jgi:hypothetical protein
MPRVLRELRLRPPRRHRQQQRRRLRCGVSLHQDGDESGIILGEVDFFAAAKAKVDQMLERAKQRTRASQKV